MTWQNVSGYLDVEANNLIEALNIRGEFTLTFSLSSDLLTLKAKRSSHDEPMGAYFEIRKSEAQKCSWCSNIRECQVFNEEYPDEVACVDSCLEYQRELYGRFEN